MRKILAKKGEILIYPLPIRRFWMINNREKDTYHRRGIIHLIFAFAFILSSFSCSSFKEHLAMKDGASFYRQGKWEDAVKKYEEAISLNPYRPITYKYLGFCYWNMIEPGSTAEKDMTATRKALEAFQKYLQLVGNDDVIQDYIINLYINQNLLDEGVKYYEALLKEKPDDVRIMLTLSKIYAKMGNFQKSLDYSIKRARLLNDDTSDRIYIGALCWERSHSKQDSLEDREKIVNIGLENIEKALNNDKKNAFAYVYKGLLYRELQDIYKIRAEDEKNKKKQKELLARADEFLLIADKVREIAIDLRKKEKSETEESVSK